MSKLYGRWKFEPCVTLKASLITCDFIKYRRILNMIVTFDRRPDEANNNAHK